MRSSMTTSAPSTAASSDDVAVTPNRPMPGSIIVVGPQTHTSAPSIREQQHVGPQHPAVQQVADNRDLERRQRRLVLANRQDVEQSLGGVLVHAIAGINDARSADAGQQLTGPRRLVPKHDHVRRHRFYVAGRIRQRFITLDHASTRTRRR